MNRWQTRAMTAISRPSYFGLPVESTASVCGLGEDKQHGISGRWRR